MNSIFDPAGTLLPYVTRARVLLQSLWIQELSWDEPLQERVLAAWQSWLSELGDLDSVTIDRQYWPADFEPVSLELHAFADSSETVFASCCYIRATDCQGITHVALVMSRARVAPVGKKR